MRFRYVFKKLCRYYFIIIPVTAVCLLLGYLLSGNNSTQINFGATVNVVVGEESLDENKIDLLIKDTLQMAQSDDLRKLVIENPLLSKYHLEMADLRDIKLEQGLSGTSYIKITYSTEDPKKTKEIMEVFIDEFKNIMIKNNPLIQNVIDVNSPAPVEIDASSRIKTMIMAGVAGFVIVCLVLLIPYLFVDRVYSGTDLEEIYAGKTLGNLPAPKEKKE